MIISELHYLAESLDEVLAFEFGGEEGALSLAVRNAFCNACETEV